MAVCLSLCSLSCPSVFLSVCPSVRMSVFLSFCLSLPVLYCLFIVLSFCRLVRCRICRPGSVSATVMCVRVCLCLCDILFRMMQLKFRLWKIFTKFHRTTSLQSPYRPWLPYRWIPSNRHGHLSTHYRIR